MSKLYAELMRSVEAVRTKQQDTHKEIEVLRDMSYEDNIYVEFEGYGIEVKARVYVVDALIKELEFKLSELRKAEVDLLKVLESISGLEL